MTLLQPSPPSQKPPSRSVQADQHSHDGTIVSGGRFHGGDFLPNAGWDWSGGLGYLQLVEGKVNRKLADSNRIRLIPKQPERGKILDRKGRILAGSRLSHAVFLWPLARKKSDWATTIHRLSQVLNIPEASIRKRLEQAGYNSPTLLRIARSVSPAQVTALAEYGNELEGVVVDAEAVRYYPNGDLAAHVIGYTGELNDEQLDRYKDKEQRLSPGRCGGSDGRGSRLRRSASGRVGRTTGGGGRSRAGGASFGQKADPNRQRCDPDSRH